MCFSTNLIVWRYPKDEAGGHALLEDRDQWVAYLYLNFVLVRLFGWALMKGVGVCCGDAHVSGCGLLVSNLAFISLVSRGHKVDCCNSSCPKGSW